MLKDLFAGIARYQKSDPSKLIENLKEPFDAVEESSSKANPIK